MFQTVEIVWILLAALAMAPALAHQLELHGKSRLTKDAYLTVQAISVRDSQLPVAPAKSAG